MINFLFDNKKTNLTNNQGHEEIMLVDDENQKTYITQELTQELKSLAPNTILYGVPGCGKSYYINKMFYGSDILEIYPYKAFWV